MSLQRTIKNRAQRRALRVRNRITAPIRVSVFRSLNNIYAQIIDDMQHKTLVSSSSLVLENVNGNKKDIAFRVGQDLAKKALTLGITKAAFDRGNKLYHGRIKSLAEGLREGGLTI